jgi:hypothetical protein
MAEPVEAQRAGLASDADFLVDFEPGRSLLDLASLLVDLEDLLGHPVDVVTEPGLKARIRPAGAPSGGRRPLRELDAATRTAIESARGAMDSDAAMAAWEHALHQAAPIIPYYRETNPEFAAPAKRTIEEILADVDA